MRTIPEEWRHAQSSTSPLFDPCTLGGTALSPGFGTNDEDQTVKLATIGDIPNHAACILAAARTRHARLCRA